MQGLDYSWCLESSLAVLVTPKSRWFVVSGWLYTETPNTQRQTGERPDVVMTLLLPRSLTSKRVRAVRHASPPRGPRVGNTSYPVNILLIARMSSTYAVFQASSELTAAHCFIKWLVLHGAQPDGSEPKFANIVRSMLHWKSRSEHVV